MAKQYRLTRVDSSNGTDVAREEDSQKTSQREKRYDDQMMAMRQPSTSRRWRFAFIGLVIVIVAVGVAVWMNGVSGSLSQLHQTAVQNTHSIANANAQLSSIQTHLQMLRLQMSQLSQQITNAFQKVMQAIHAG